MAISSGWTILKADIGVWEVSERETYVSPARPVSAGPVAAEPKLRFNAFDHGVC